MVSLQLKEAAWRLRRLGCVASWQHTLQLAVTHPNVLGVDLQTTAAKFLIYGEFR